MLKTFNVLFGDLNVTLEFKNINKELSLVGELLLVVVDELSCTGVRKLREHIEEHGVTIRLFHDFGNFCIQIADQGPCWVVDDLVEAFKTDSTFSNVTVEQPNSNYDIRKFAELCNFFRCGQGNEGSQTGSRKDAFKCSCNFSFDSVRDSSRELDVRIVANDVLLVLVEQVVEDLLVEERDAFEVVSRSRFKTDNLIDQAV